MGGQKAAALAALLGVTMLAGCLGGGGDGDSDVPDDLSAGVDDLDLQATATTGVIRGIVVDEAVRPVAGAEVGTSLPDGTARNTTTTEAGAFGFEGLPPGTYFLHVRKAGYRDAQASVDVVAGVSDPPITKILLAVDPATVPYYSAFQYDAFLACSFTLVLVSFAACGLAAAQTNNEFLVEYEVDKLPRWIQVEAMWESNQALGSSLSLSITDFSTGAQVGVNGSSGPSPIYATVNESVAQRFNYTGPGDNPVNIRLFSTAAEGTDLVPQEVVHAAWAASGYPVYNSTGLDPTVDDAFDTVGLFNPLGEQCIRWVVLFNACMGAGGIGVVLQQQVDVFTHVFYGYAPEAGWRFSDGSGVPPPPA